MHSAAVHKYIRKVFHNDMQGESVTKETRPGTRIHIHRIVSQKPGDYITCNIHFELQDPRLVPYSVLGAFAQQISQPGGFWERNDPGG